MTTRPLVDLSQRSSKQSLGNSALFSIRCINLMKVGKYITTNDLLIQQLKKVISFSSLLSMIRMKAETGHLSSGISVLKTKETKNDEGFITSIRKHYEILTKELTI